jgi:hypothetical protein
MTLLMPKGRRSTNSTSDAPFRSGGARRWLTRPARSLDSREMTRALLVALIGFGCSKSKPEAPPKADPPPVAVVDRDLPPVDKMP